jgi:hypothetical protein
LLVTCCTITQATLITGNIGQILILIIRKESGYPADGSGNGIHIMEEDITEFGFLAIGGKIATGLYFFPLVKLNLT